MTIHKYWKKDKKRDKKGKFKATTVNHFFYTSMIIGFVVYFSTK